MAWDDDKKKTTHVAHDKDVETAEREGRETIVAPERVAVGRAITRGLFTAGTGLLKGRPRKGGKVTITYVRAPGPREGHAGSRSQ